MVRMADQSECAPAVPGGPYCQDLMASGRRPTWQSLILESLPLAEARYAAAIKALSDYYAPQPAPELPKKAKHEDIKKMIM